MKREFFLVISNFLVISGFFFLSTTFIQGCNKNKCSTIGKTRCNKNIAQICTSEKHWIDVWDCSKDKLKCDKLKDIHTCTGEMKCKNTK